MSMIVVTRTDDYLAHHGVKGMKWGVRNEETRAKYAGGNSSRRRAIAKGLAVGGVVGGIYQAKKHSGDGTNSASKKAADKGQKHVTKVGKVSKKSVKRNTMTRGQKATTAALALFASPVAAAAYAKKVSAKSSSGGKKKVQSTSATDSKPTKSSKPTQTSKKSSSSQSLGTKFGKAVASTITKGSNRNRAIKRTDQYRKAAGVYNAVVRSL